METYESYPPQPPEKDNGKELINKGFVSLLFSLIVQNIKDLTALERQLRRLEKRLKERN